MICKWIKGFFSRNKEEDIKIVDHYNHEYDYTDWEKDLIIAVNQHRVGLRMGECLIDDWLSNIALEHNLKMIADGRASHSGFPQRHVTIKVFMKAESVGENVAYGFNTVKGLLNGWIRSHGHRAILEEPKFNYMGLSSIRDKNGRTYTTNIFVKKAYE